ncbi:MAG: biotin--[acetyl-CoA-carboxylase] ligase [Candidatus Eremiobacteraeota bacterium]|nr:biotin--[acetyl-CoA-carboxylase] ligase [Candidatus Eremiobacteraeota bacterium]
MYDFGPYSAVAEDLAGTPFSAIAYRAETGSTNDDAAALLGDPAAAGLTIVAERQTHGKGRRGRTWIAHPGSALLFTTILPRELPSSHLWAVPFWTVLAVHRALRDCAIEASIVWPNDLLLGTGKVAGVLCASRVSGESAWSACGIGINLRRSPEAAERIDPLPGFCDDVAPVDGASLLRSILRAFDASLDALDNPQRVARVWETTAKVPGRRYRLLKDGEREPFEATAIALANGGGLVVRRDDGTRETIALADARALR